MPERLLVIGGTRSGKSRYALEQARSRGGDAVTFIATAHPGDPELDRRIAAHRAERPPLWLTRQADRNLARTIGQSDPTHLLLVDSLTLWASIVVEEEGALRPRWPDLSAALQERRRPVVLVSEEVGMGIIPTNELARRYVDELGWLNQMLAGVCDEVRLMVAGIPLPLKGAP